ncbi:MAG: NAD(P)H-quinone oxidoreductase [Pseudomonadales bacterium]|nr:NAD(P)H-quinone oxidoreductase [Pseudomonadales bacterium]MDA0762092.1 NAD(P)H-quinone oxidoreductase [Pseudomonadota bacterium]MDA0956509.1 NAD(P)H-quinone oxidoreductase [Pseudomonadota bacterium]
MQAIVVSDAGELNWQEAEKPMLGASDVMIEIKATAVNRADLMQRRGLYPAPPGASSILGLECAGTIVQLGSDVTRHQIGDSVCALLAGGGYAEFAAVDEGSVIPVPKGLSFSQAAALPEVFATAWLNLFIEGGLQPSERVLLHAGASGVGTAGIQLCRAFGSECFVTVGSEDKIAACRSLGAIGGFDRTQGSFLSALKDQWNDGVDVILDPVGASYLDDNLQALKLNGRLILIGLMGGARSEIDLAQLMIKRLRVQGSTLRSRALSEKAAIMAELQQFVWPKIEQGDIKPIVQQVIPIEQAAAAHDLVASDATIGKVVLSVAK